MLRDLKLDTRAWLLVLKTATITCKHEHGSEGSELGISADRTWIR